MRDGVAAALTSLGPLLRPFITRWWADKAAQLNPSIEDARSALEFERFLFGRDRVALQRIGEGLLDIQAGRCLYCQSSIGRNRQIDHFIPLSQSGDDGLFNLVATCNICNRSKSGTLAGPEFVSQVLERNDAWRSDLAALGEERSWPADENRSARIARASYLLAPDEKPL
jgi:5-methylcytosine-specific restriction endonuclease McrA